MNPHQIEALWISAGVLVAATVTVWLLRRRRPTPAQIECARRLHVNAVGRLASGEIIDLLPAPGDNTDAGAGANTGDAAPPLPPTLIYGYEIAGVSYEASQQLHLVPLEIDPQSWIPGHPVQVKYDPTHPGNSIVVCEHWTGLQSRKARTREQSVAASSLQ